MRGFGRCRQGPDAGFLRVYGLVLGGCRLGRRRGNFPVIPDASPTNSPSLSFTLRIRSVDRVAPGAGVFGQGGRPGRGLSDPEIGVRRAYERSTIASWLTLPAQRLFISAATQKANTFMGLTSSSAELRRKNLSQHKMPIVTAAVTTMANSSAIQLLREYIWLEWIFQCARIKCAPPRAACTHQEPGLRWPSGQTMTLHAVLAGSARSLLGRPSSSGATRRRRDDRPGCHKPGPTSVQCGRLSGSSRCAVPAAALLVLLTGYRSNKSSLDRVIGAQ